MFDLLLYPVCCAQPLTATQVYKLNLMVDVLLSASFLFVIVHYSGRKDYGDETAAVAAVGSIVLLLLLMAQLIKASNSTTTSNMLLWW